MLGLLNVKTNNMKVELTQEEIDMIWVLSQVYLNEHKDEWTEEAPHIIKIKSLIEKTKHLKIK